MGEGEGEALSFLLCVYEIFVVGCDILGIGDFCLEECD